MHAAPSPFPLLAPLSSLHRSNVTQSFLGALSTLFIHASVSPPSPLPHCTTLPLSNLLVPFSSPPRSNVTQSWAAVLNITAPLADWSLTDKLPGMQRLLGVGEARRKLGSEIVTCGGDVLEIRQF